MSDSGFAAPPPPPLPPDAGGPGWAGGGDAIPPRGLGNILSAAFEIYKANAAKLIVIVAVVVVPLSFINHFLTGVVLAANKTTVQEGPFGSYTTVAPHSFVILIAVSLTGALIAVITWAILQAAIMRGAVQATVGEAVDVEASYKWGLEKFGGVLRLAILIGIPVIIGFVLLIIPGVILLTFFAVSVPALVVENCQGTEAMSRSWNLVKGNFWHVLGTMFVATLITGIVSGIIGAFAGSNWFMGWIFGSIAQILVAPFSALVSIILYLDLRARTEGLTATTLRTALKEASPSS